MYKTTVLFCGALAASLSFATISEAQPKRPTARAPLAAQPVTLQRSDADLFAATLAGRFAQGTDNPVLAAQAWTRAALRRPLDKHLFENAVAANLQAGDVPSAVRLAKMAPPTLINESAALVLAVDALAQRRYGDVGRVLSGRSFQPSLAVFVDHLAAYALLGENKRAEAVERTTRVTGISALDRTALMSRAIVLDRANRAAEAEILFQSAVDSKVIWPVGVHYYGDWLVRNNRKSDAIALYQRLSRGADAQASSFGAELSRMQGSAPARPPSDLTASASAGLITIAQGLAAQGRGGPPMSMFNLIAHLDPRSDSVAVAVADQLITESRPEMATPLLLGISSTSPAYLIARTELVWLVFASDKAQAVSLARETLRARPGQVAAERLLADVLAANREDSEAEIIYGHLIDKSKMAGQAIDESWPLYFGRGGARERLGRWSEARADLQIAKNAAPNQPNVLNFLGYALADRGESLDEALVMLRTAARLQPRSGAIQDSLGWALFKAGRYEEAVGILESAANMSPALSDISDHLGDAYWRSGREAEARMEWNRTLRLDHTPDQKQRIEAKLIEGLPKDPNEAARRAIASQAPSSAQP